MSLFEDQVAICTANEPSIICQRRALTVYECFDAERGLPVVVKRVSLIGDKKAQETLGLLQIEANLMMRVQHPNVLPCYGTRYLEAEDCFELILEPGISLADLVRDQGLPQKEIFTYFAQIAAGLAALHSHGIVHGDIKCDNIIIVDGVAKIADFGGAILLSHPHEGLFKVRGTVGFIAPEIARGNGCQFASDIWSLGATLYEMVTQVMPFHGCHQNGYLYHVGMCRPTPLTFQEPYDHYIEWCQSPQPEERPLASQLLDHLATWLSV